MYPFIIYMCVEIKIENIIFMKINARFSKYNIKLSSQ